MLDLDIRDIDDIINLKGREKNSVIPLLQAIQGDLGNEKK